MPGIARRWLSEKTKKMTRIFFILLLVFLGGITARGQLSGKLRRQVDAVFAEMNHAGSPGCALAIAREGKPLYLKGYGMADLEQGVAIDEHTVFYAGSVSKQFVAACVLLLREQGKLELDDEVRRYVPELPDYGRPITIRHLLHHTSGLRDYLALWTMSGRDYLDRLVKDEVLELICRQAALNFAPGERYAYSNSGYFLLGLIVERLSGQSLANFAQRHIFEPLDMRRSHFHEDYRRLVRKRAHGYAMINDGAWGNLPMRFDLVGSGGLYTTAEDLAKWDANFYRNRLGVGQPTFIDTLVSDGRLASGESAGYAFALVNGAYRGAPTQEHTGSLGGYRAYFLRFPQEKLTIILLGNFASFTPVRHARAVADLLMAKAFSEADEPVSAVGSGAYQVQIDATVMDKAPGRYYSRELNAFARMWRQDEALWLRVGYGPAKTLHEWANSIPIASVEFIRMDGENIEAFLLSTGDIRGIRFARME
jgi:CubicO group peptidase (beta-lactamase class C family)